jgi:hypothetical protein
MAEEVACGARPWWRAGALEGCAAVAIDVVLRWAVR